MIPSLIRLKENGPGKLQLVLRKRVNWAVAMRGDWPDRLGRNRKKGRKG